MKIYCFKCLKWMEKIRTGVTITDNKLTYLGDTFKCLTCGNVVISDFGEPYER